MGIVMAACEFRNCDYEIIETNTPILNVWDFDENGLIITILD